MSKTGIIYHPDYLKHDTGFGHPESPYRLTSILDRLRDSDLLNELTIIEPTSAKEEDILLIHTREHLEMVKSAWNGGLASLTPDTPISEDSFRVALLAVGGVLTGIDRIMAGEIKMLWPLYAPPGIMQPLTRRWGSAFLTTWP